ncbi:unnamed protein product [Symbiodinium sp. KB8]|nr:unnamed protein product [Symbiodinium sp. KB8]
MWRGALLLLRIFPRVAALRNHQVTSLTDEVDEECGHPCHLIDPIGESYYVGFQEVEGMELKAGSQYDLRTSSCGETSDEPMSRITITQTGEKDRHGLVKGELEPKLEWNLDHIEKLEDGDIRICTSGENARCICKLDASFLVTKNDTNSLLRACLPLAVFACGVGFFSGSLYCAYYSWGRPKEQTSAPSAEDTSASKSPALSICQIRDRWLWAFGSCLVALSCGTPFLGILTTGYMFWEYSCKQTHRLFWLGAKKKKLPLQVLTEGILWTSLFQACLYTIVTYTKRYLRLYASDASNMKAETQKILAEAEVGVIVVACTFGSTILWRVLLINALEIAQNVHQHRKKAKEKLPDKAKEIWRQLQLKFDKYFPAMEPPVTVTEMLEDGDKTEIWRQLQLKFYKYFPAMEPPVTVTEMLEDGDKTEKTEKNIFGKVDFWSIDKALIFTSTLVLGMSLIVLQCRLDWTAAHEERVPSYLVWRRRGLGRYAYAGMAGSLTAYVAAHHWFQLTSATVGITRRFKQLPQRMLLFSFLATTSEQVETRGDESQQSVDDMRQYLKEQAAELKETQLEESLKKSPAPDLQKVVYQLIGQELTLDLGKRSDIQAWAQLRDFINLDFLDASAIMECAGTVIVLQIVNFAFAGIVVWFREGVNPAVAPGLWLVLLLSLLLIKLLFRVLLVCVRANFMLDRDARRLMGVEVVQLQEPAETDIEKEKDMTVQKPSGPKKTDIEMVKEMTNRTLTGALIHAVQRQAEASEYMQKLFGITVTVTMLQGWMISLAVLFLQAVWSLAGQQIVNLDPAQLAAELICWRKTGYHCNTTRTFDQ